MSGFLQTLAGGVVGAGAVLAAIYLPGAFGERAPEPAAVSVVAAPTDAEPAMPETPADHFGPGVVILAQSAEDCPAGWRASGRVGLVTSPEYQPVEGQERTNPGVMTSATTGFANIPFALCVKEAMP